VSSQQQAKTLTVAAVDLTDDEFAQIEKLAESHPPKRVCDQSDLYEPYYDIYQENDPKYSDKVQFAQAD